MEPSPLLIVTGGSRGIGAAVARRAGARGWAVAVNYVGRGDAARAVVADIARVGGRAVAVQADVAVEADVCRLFETAERELLGGGDGSSVRGLVNNAGVTGGFARVADLTAETLARVFAVNVTGTILCAREAVRRMSTTRPQGGGAAGGSIVNVSSRAARLGGAGEWVHYAASKGAVETFTVGLAREVAAEGIRVNAVTPGLVETELHATAGEPDRAARLAPGIPLGRAGTPEEVAEAVLWLLSPAAAYVTGAVLDVAGGR